MVHKASFTFCISLLLTAVGIGASAQQTSLRITSPSNGDTILEGQPFRISVSADDSVRMISIIATGALPNARPLGSNVFEMTIPRTVPLGKYNLTAFGVASTEVASEPVSIQEETDSRAIGLQVQPLMAFLKVGDRMPMRVIAQFADGRKLDVTNSRKTTFESKNTNIVRVDSQATAVAQGPGKTAILIGYDGAPYSAIVILGPGTDLSGRIIPMNESARDASTSDGEGMLESTTSTVSGDEIKINAIGGGVAPGNRIHIFGIGFGAGQGDGFVTVANVRAEVASWNEKEIVVIVPKFESQGRTTKVSVHQGQLSEDFPVFLSVSRVQ